MFNNTNLKETLPIKIAKNLPKDSVGISFFESEIIDPNEIIQLIDESNKIDNNNPNNKPDEIIAYNNINNEIKLSSIDYNKFLAGETINVTVTNRFENDTPLYFKAELMYPFKTKNIPNDNNIKFVDKLNNILDLGKYNAEIKISFENIKDNGMATDLYKVVIYSSTILDKEIYAKYTGYKNGYIDTNIKEEISFHDALEQNVDYSLIKKEEPGNLYGINFVDNVSYISPKEHLKFKDERNKVELIYKIKSENYSTSAIKASIINPDFTIDKNELNLPSEDGYDQELFYLLEGKTPIDYLLEEDSTLTPLDLIGESFEFEIIEDYDDERIYKNIIVKLDSSGEIPVGVKVFCNTGYGYKDQIKPDKTLKYNKLTDESYNKFAILINDNKAIKLTKPLLNFSDNNWNVKVDYGYFYQNRDDGIYKYVLDDVKEKFDTEIGLPYNKIIKEKPLIINNNLIKTRMNNISNINDFLKLYRYNQYGIKEEIDIKKINKEEGLIFIDNINKNEDLFVDYYYKKNEIIYNGYYNEYYNKYIYLDLKPNKDNYSVLPFMNNKIESNLFLINRPIYFYLRPKYKIISETKVEVNSKELIYHTFEEKTNQTEDLLIGKVIVSPNINKGDIELIDIRKKGGGIKEDYKEVVNTEKDINTNNFWDYGYWNGTPYNKNNVMIININNSILKINGGYLSEEEVERKVNKWVGFGNLPLINYVNSYKGDHLNFEKTTDEEILNKIDFEIKFFLEQYRTTPNSKHSVSVYGQSFSPQLMIQRLDEPLDHEIVNANSYNSNRSIHLEPLFEKVNTTEKPKLNSSVYNSGNKNFKDSMRVFKTYKTVQQPASKSKTYNTVNIKKASIETYEK